MRREKVAAGLGFARSQKEPIAPLRSGGAGTGNWHAAAAIA